MICTGLRAEKVARICLRLPRTRIKTSDPSFKRVIPSKNPETLAEHVTIRYLMAGTSSQSKMISRVVSLCDKSVTYSSSNIYKGAQYN